MNILQLPLLKLSSTSRNFAHLTLGLNSWIMSKERPHFRHVGGSQSTVTQFPGRCQAGGGAEGIKGMLVALCTLVFSLIMETAPSIIPATFAFRCMWCSTWKGPERLCVEGKSRLFWSSMTDSLWLFWSNLQTVCWSLLIYVYQYQCTSVYQYIDVYQCTDLHWYTLKCTIIDE